jgi:hypothetical protein
MTPFRRSVIGAGLLVIAVAIVLSYRSWLQPESVQPRSQIVSPDTAPAPDPTSMRSGDSARRPDSLPAAGTRPLSPDQAHRTIAARDADVVAAIVAHDVEALSRFVHPVKGIRISHYTYVRPDSDNHFTAAQLREAWQSPRELYWGESDGTGEPIRMPLRAYLGRFYTKDFARAPRVGYNASPIGTGNTLHNIGAVYPGAIVVEHHFPGFDEQYGGMDWQSLWLMYEPHDGSWYLVGIARGFWTI